MATLDELLEAKTAEEVKTIILASLQAAAENDGFPVTDWAEGGVERTLIEGFAAAVADFESSLPLIAKGGFVSLSEGEWLTLLSEHYYQITQNEATHTEGVIELYCAAGAGPYTFAARDAWFIGAGGNRYVNTEAGTLREPGFSSVVQTGTGTGTVTAVSPDDIGISVKIQIIAGGALGVATYQLSTDGGATYGDTTTTPGGGTTTADPRTGVVVTFAGTFTASDTYAFDIYGTLALDVESEQVNDSVDGFNYIDATGTITRMVTPLPGVTCENATSARSFTTVVHVGSGSGTIEVRAKTYADVTAGVYEIEILSTGEIGVATFRYRKDAGSWSGTLTSAAIYTDATLDGYNVVIRFTAGDETPSFVDNDTYETTSPDTWLTQQGTDKEADPALRIRDRARWPALSAVPTDPVYELWARNASEEVTRVLVVESATINNRVNVYIAGQAGGLGSDVVNEVQDYIDARKPLTDDPVVASATATAITLSGGTVRVQASLLTTAQQNAQSNVATYLASVDVGGTVRLNQVIEAILRESGGEDDDVTGLLINGSAANLSLGSTNVATWSQLIASALTWSTYTP